MSFRIIVSVEIEVANYNDNLRSEYSSPIINIISDEISEPNKNKSRKLNH